MEGHQKGSRRCTFSARRVTNLEAVNASPVDPGEVQTSNVRRRSKPNDAFLWRAEKISRMASVIYDFTGSLPTLYGVKRRMGPDSRFLGACPAQECRWRAGVGGRARLP